MHPKHLSLIAALPNWAGQIKLNAASVAGATQRRGKGNGNGNGATPTRNGSRICNSKNNCSNKNNSYYNNLLQKYKLEHL